MTQFKETLKITKQHFVESFVEIFTSQFEQVCVWFMFFFAIGFGVATVLVPVLLQTKYGFSGYVYLSFILTIPLEVIIICGSVNWMAKVFRW